MNLALFFSDKGIGYRQSPVYVNPEEVASVTESADRYSSSDNKTVITLKNGQCLHVKEWSSDVVKKLAEAGKTT